MKGSLMTKKVIKEKFNSVYNLDQERVVDIDTFNTCIDIQMTTIISITKNHIVWKRTFTIENNELHFLDCECL